jgi:probable HAF family extracellular repeat protein
LDPNNSSSIALAINDTGQVVGQSNINGLGTATEWDDGDIIGLGLLPRFLESSAAGINDVGQAVGTSLVSPPLPTPEPSTWAMMLLGFSGLAFAGYRRSPSRIRHAGKRWISPHGSTIENAAGNVKIVTFGL